MSCVHLIAAFGVGAVWCTATLAATIVNRDDRDYTLTISETGSSKQQVLKRAGVLEGICTKGCSVRLNGSGADDYLLEGDESVIIEGGLIYYSGPVPQTAPSAADDKPTGGKQ